MIIFSMDFIVALKVHKREKFFVSDFELVKLKY